MQWLLYSSIYVHHDHSETAPCCPVQGNSYKEPDCETQNIEVFTHTEKGKSVSMEIGEIWSSEAA